MRGWGLLELRPMRMSLEEIFLQVTTEEPSEGGRRRRRPVRNIFAIAQKELRSYFSSPIAYIIIGFFALPFGVFFYLYLGAFVRQSLQMAQYGGSMNINQQVIRYVLQNASVIILFIMPMITMRTYSEEKRSGTIELLLTSPVTDVADHPRQVPRRARALRRDAARDGGLHRRSCSSTATRSGGRWSRRISACC